MANESQQAKAAGQHEPTLRSDRREQWAGIVAAIATGLHCLVSLAVFVWFYAYVPDWKRELNDLRTAIPKAAQFLLDQSDICVNYPYLLVLLLPPALIVDFRLTRWIGKQVGLRWACLCAACIAVSLLSHAAYGHYVLQQTLTQLTHELSLRGTPAG